MEDVRLQEKIKAFLSVDNGSGSGYGDGSGDGYGYGYDDGAGLGSGYGSGIKRFNGQRVYMIDDTPTIIELVKGAAARGFILCDDLTLRPCWIARHGNCFAHGATLKEATRDAIAKWQEDRPLEEKIADFVKAHPDPDVPYGDLFEWHHILTGSCELGRREWCKAHGYQPTDKITVRTFIEQTVNDYGGNVIRELAKEYRIDL